MPNLDPNYPTLPTTILEGTGARAEIWHGDTGARGHWMLEGTGARDEIWHGDTGARDARGHGGTG